MSLRFDNQIKSSNEHCPWVTGTQLKRSRIKAESLSTDLIGIRSDHMYEVRSLSNEADNVVLYLNTLLIFSTSLNLSQTNFSQAQKDIRGKRWLDFLESFDNGAHFLEHGTGDEFWMFEYDTKIKRQNIKWHISTFPKPKNARQSKSKVLNFLNNLTLNSILTNWNLEI